MAKYKPKAQKNFEERLAQAIMWRDFDLVELLFTQYGYYHDLVDSDPDGDAEEVVAEFVPVKYDVTERLPEWEAPAFKYRSNVTQWRLELDLEASEAEQAAWAFPINSPAVSGDIPF